LAINKKPNTNSAVNNVIRDKKSRFFV